MFWMGARRQESDSDEIVVFSIVRDSICGECGRELWRGEFLRMEDGKPLCLTCADLDHLVFLPRGDAALTRRATKHSALHAIVVRFTRARKRYERQGILVEESALEKAERECLADEEARALARERAADRRARLDAEYVEKFAERVRGRYPGCAPSEERVIAERACERYSARVGRSAAAKQFDPEAIDLAVRAHVRHMHTEYETLLIRGWSRGDARAAVASRVEEILDGWIRHTRAKE
jgi:hypothetical protein